jgi:hypothetical protein
MSDAATLLERTASGLMDCPFEKLLEVARHHGQALVNAADAIRGVHQHGGIAEERFDAGVVRLLRDRAAAAATDLWMVESCVDTSE